MHESAAHTLTDTWKFRLELHCWCPAVQLLAGKIGQCRVVTDRRDFPVMVLLGTIQGSASPLSKYLWRGTTPSESSCIPIWHKMKTSLSSRKSRPITWTSWDTIPLAAKPWTQEHVKNASFIFCSSYTIAHLSPSSCTGLKPNVTFQQHLAGLREAQVRTWTKRSKLDLSTLLAGIICSV